MVNELSSENHDNENYFHRRYDLEKRMLYREIGFWILAFTFVLAFILCLWFVKPDLTPFLPDRFWIAGIPVFFFSLLFWGPLIIFGIDNAFYSK